MVRNGTVLVFKAGTSETEIREALDKLSAILDPVWIESTEDYFVRNKPYKIVPYRVETFNDEYGNPVWYVP